MTGLRGLVATGAAATLAAVVATTATAALARAAGVELEVPDGGETIPLSGIAFVTGVLSLVGVGIAAGLHRWTTHPARRFVLTTVTLTGISLVPPFASGASAPTAVTLVLLHLLAATVMIPALARRLATRGTDDQHDGELVGAGRRR